LPTLNLQQWDFLFFFAFVIGLYSIHRLASVREVGKVEEKIVVREFISQSRGMMRNLSSAGGIRQMMYLPSWAFRHLTRRRRTPIGMVGETASDKDSTLGPSA